MTIPFQKIPPNIRTPLFYGEIDNSRANTAVQPQRTLVIGQTLNAAGVNTPAISQGASRDAQTLGAASMLAAMLGLYRKNDPLGELWALPVADNPAGAAAQGSVAFTHVVSFNTTAYLYIGNDRYVLPILSTQTTSDMATAFAAMINANPASPVTAVATANAVGLTAVHKGPAANDLQLRWNYLGAAGGEVFDNAGLNIGLTQMAGGTGVPDLTAALANLGDRTFDVVVCPYTDTASLQALAALMNDTTGRWSYTQQLYGHVFAASRGALSALVTTGTGLNNQHLTMLGYQGSPTPMYLWVCAFAAAAAASLRTDPALPLQSVVVQGVVPPSLQQRFVLVDRNTLLYNGISTFTVADDGTVAIENTITTYKQNAAGLADDSYLEVETLFTLMYVLRDLRSMVTTKYARVKLAADGTRFAPGSGVVTPNIIRADLIARYATLEEQGLVQGATQFAAALIVEQDATNPNRVNILWPAILIDQLRIFAALVQFRLQV